MCRSHSRVIAAVILAGALTGCSSSPAEGPAESPASAAAPAATPDLLERALASVDRSPLVPLAPADDASLVGTATLEAPGSGRVPNTLRALVAVPKYVAPFAETYRSVLVGGSLDPALKMAMALRVAQMHESPYVAAHMARLLRAAEGGPVLLEAVRTHTEADANLPEASLAALRYAEWLTTDVQGVTPPRFAQVRAHYTDSEIVELTTAIGFFNFLDRFVEAQRLPLEPWVLDTEPVLPARDTTRLKARITMIDDAVLAAAPRGPNAVNSVRAMALVPDIGAAWWGLFRAIQREPVISQDILYHVSFAVSMANGCRYCSMHQVRGLADLGVDASKLMAMEKDDTVLTPRELAAVRFARDVTEAPTSITADHWTALTREFGADGALEVLVRACEFALMNRFTDNLGLPTEDVAVQTYLKVHPSGGTFSQP